MADRWVVIISGSRWMDLRQIVESEVYKGLDELEIGADQIELVMTGGAPGVDEIGKKMCVPMGVRHKEVKADWGRHGRAAGNLRNRLMLDEALKMKTGRVAVIAVWDQESTGTLDMINWARNTPKVSVSVRKFVGRFGGPYSFLSNFYPSPFWEEACGVTTAYPTVEHYFQSEKFTDLETRDRILLCSSPGKAKLTARQISMSAERKKVWDGGLKDTVMAQALGYKFTHKNPIGRELSIRLIQTGEMRLVEGNDWHDNYWGRCKCVACRLKKGENKLGKLLEQRRAVLSRLVESV